jgi:drug/metabolite transporter (DMT)-like permease
VVVGAGLLDVTANGLYLLAVREGLLSVVAVLSSLYPAATVVLARVVLGERLRPAQLAGLGLGLAGVTMIAAA